jgi:hypothetical protein
MISGYISTFLEKKQASFIFQFTHALHTQGMKAFAFQLSDVVRRGDLPLPRLTASGGLAQAKA